MDASNIHSPPRYTLEDVIIDSKKRVYQGRFAMDVYELRHRKYDGHMTPVLRREIFERDQDAVAVLPYDSRSDEVVLIEQFRPGAMRDPCSPWLVETVAGMIDAGEEAAAACIRELREEAGLEVTPEDLEYINTAYPSPGAASERVAIYLASVDASHLAEYGGLVSDHEDIRIFKLSSQEAFALLRQQRISNAASIICLLYLENRLLRRGA